MNLLKTLDEIEAAAKKATPGPWQSCNGYQGFGLIEGISKQYKVDVVVDDGTYDSQFTGVQKKCDAQYIALANPATVLQLTAALRTAVEALDGIKYSCSDPCGTGPALIRTAVEEEVEQTLADINALYAKGGKGA